MRSAAPLAFGPPIITSPGAVWHAIVRYGLLARLSPLVILKTPATRNTHVRGPEACTHARSEPEPESLVFVTSITTPPRPPAEAAPPPCAPGNAARLPGLGAVGGVGGTGGTGGVGGAGRVGFVGAVAAAHPLTLITGTLPADEKPTAQPVGATT